MSTPAINLHPAERSDLNAINGVIEAAIMTWNLPQRVKRLALSSYRYTEFDFNHLEILVAKDATHNVLGVAAWEPADKRDTPNGHTGLLLHGIYVQPTCHFQGVGRRLFQATEQAVRRHQADGVLVKAQQNANGFFLSVGMTPMPIEDTLRHYANRFWKPVSL